MPINVISIIKPANNGQFPVVEDVDVLGGLQVKATDTDRNNIPIANRKVGMLVYVVADNAFYNLVGGTANSNWQATLAPSPVLVLRPGGAVFANIYGSWTAVMTARAGIEGPATIVIDDSITSPVSVDVGTWDLTHNTSLISYKGNQNTPLQGGSTNNLTQLSIPNGAHLLNPSYFEALTITGFGTSGFSIDSGAAPTIHTGSMNFVAQDVIFQTDASATAPLIHTNGGVMDFYGCCHLVSSNSSAFIISNTATHPVIINLHDETVVDGYTLFFNDSTYEITINIMDGATFDVGNQPGISLTISVNQPSIVRSLTYNSGQSPNIVAVRPTGFRIPTDSTKSGIVNLGSDTSGTSVGATGNYSTIAGGDQNAASGDYSFAAGQGSVASGTNSVAIGQSAIASAANAIVVGDGSTASGQDAVALGGANTASGDASLSTGDGGSATRYGERAHHFNSNGIGFGIHELGLSGNSISAASTNLTDGDGNELTFVAAHCMKIWLSVVAHDQGGTGVGTVAMWGWDILAKVTIGNVFTIDHITPRAGETFANGTAWTVVPSVVGGTQTLRITCTAVGTPLQNIQFDAYVWWQEAQFVS